MESKGTRGMRSGFPQEFSVGPELGEVEGCVVGNLNGSQIGYVLQIYVGIFEIAPDLAIYTCQCSENGMEMNSGHEMGVSSEIFSRT